MKLIKINDNYINRDLVTMLYAVNNKRTHICFDTENYVPVDMSADEVAILLKESYK